jgi:hypothetical protein
MRIDAPASPLGRQWTAADAPAKAPSDANAAVAGSVAPALTSGVAAADAAGGQNSGADQGGGAPYQAQQAAGPPAPDASGGPTMQDVRTLNRLIDRVLGDLAAIGCKPSAPGQGEAQAVDAPDEHVDLRV